MKKRADEADRQRAIEDYKTELLEFVRARGISDAAVGYAAFLRLTTFGPAHLGDAGSYALRMDGAEVVGVGAGLGCPVHHELFAKIEMEAMAEHHRDARLDFPTTIEVLVHWIFQQAGDVELAIPDSDEYPVDPANWVKAATGLAIPSPAKSAGNEATAKPEKGVGVRDEAYSSISQVARAGGNAKRNNSPKQKAKEGALELWKQRDDGKHPNLGTVAQFATEVMRRWPILENSKVIEGWSAKWSKDVREGRTPAC